MISFTKAPTKTEPLSSQRKHTALKSIRPNKRVFSWMLDLQSRSLSYSSSAAAIVAVRTIQEGQRSNWKRKLIKSIYNSSLLDLIFHRIGRVLWKKCSTIALKRSRIMECDEYCGYCLIKCHREMPINSQIENYSCRFILDMHGQNNNKKNYKGNLGSTETATRCRLPSRGLHGDGNGTGTPWKRFWQAGDGMDTR
ncbi:putative biotin synthase [Helianthus debilis subsp. tardiflorus]